MKQGVFDEATKAEMGRERCGMKDTGAIEKILAESSGVAYFKQIR